MKFDYRTFKTKDGAARYATQLDEAKGTESVIFRPYEVQRGADKGLWTVARYSFHAK